jgi:molybdate transport system substrate-binding protein
MRVLTPIITLVITVMAVTPLAIAQQQAPLRVLASNGMKAVIDELRPRLESEVGRRLNIDFNTSIAVRQRIESGEDFDLTVLTTEVVNELAKAGKITSGSVTDLGRSGIGFGVRDGAPAPDIRTPEAVKQTLLNAKSMTWVSIGASRAHIDRMIEALGIASQVKSKIDLTQSVDESIAHVAQGKTEMIITLTSEILPAKGVRYVGPLPAKFQNYVSFSAGISPKSSVPAAAALFIKRLAAPTAAPVYQAKGMELPVVGDVDKSARRPVPTPVK